MKWYWVFSIAHASFWLGFFFAALFRTGKEEVGYNTPPDTQRPGQPTPRPPEKL